MQTICFCARSGDKDKTVLSVLRQQLNISASMISRLKRAEFGITVNGDRAYVTHVLKPGDFLHISFPDETDGNIYANKEAEGFNVLYEDDSLVIINKPAGLSVQPVKDQEEITLETYLREYLGCKVRPHPVSRLDKGTSGIMTVAKTAYIHELIKRQMHTFNYYKEYRAILTACPEKKTGTVSAPIGFYEGSTYARTVRMDGAPSVSQYEILNTKGKLVYAKLVPVTGRTHQLRVHMSYIGCPLLGDWLYGERSEQIERAALHSYYLRICHPLTGSLMEITCPLPADMEKLLNGI